MRVAVLFFLCLVLSTESIGQKVLYELISDGVVFSDRNYTYEEVLDQRVDKAQIGLLHDAHGEAHPVDIKGGITSSLLELYNYKVNPSGSPFLKVQVIIKEIRLYDFLDKATNLYEGGVELTLGFYLIGTADPIFLTDYTGSLFYRRTANRSEKVRRVVNSIFHKAAAYFDEWEKSNNLGNPVLARNVKLKIHDLKKENTRDTVFYDRKRPLVWKDFRDVPNPVSKFNASIFTSFSMEGNAIMKDGQIEQTLSFKVYMLPAQSWVKSPSDYAINHEQLHFDLVRIEVDRLMDRLKKMELDAEFYGAKIHMAYLDALRKLNKLQEKYDSETQNGLNKGAQAKWERLIKNALNGEWQELEGYLPLDN